MSNLDINREVIDAMQKDTLSCNIILKQLFIEHRLPVIEILIYLLTLDVWDLSISAAYSLNMLNKYCDSSIKYIVLDKYNISDFTDKIKIGCALSLMHEKEILQIMLFGLKHSDAMIRRKAIFSIGYIGDNSSIIYLLNLLSDLDNNIRMQVVISLGNIRTHEVVSPLVKVLMNNDNRDIRAAACRSLGITQDPDAFEPLLNALEDDDPIIRSSVIEGMDLLRDHRAIEPLIIALRDIDPSVRSRAAEALGWQRDERAIEPLIYISYHDNNENVRNSAREALIELHAI